MLGRMKFALLGADEDSIALAQAAVEAGHEIVWCGDLASARVGRDLPWLSVEDLGGQWETLLDRSACEAVFVGRGEVPSDLRAEQVNQLAKHGVAVLATFPLVDSVLSFYEIDMARREGQAVLLHFNPLTQQSPAIEQCARWVVDRHPELGKVEQIIWHRPLSERTRERALWHFSRDVELLGQVAGPLNRLGALGSPDEETTYAGLSVQLLGKSKVPVRWEVGPANQPAQPSLLVVAEKGTLTVEFDEAGQASEAVKRLVLAIESEDRASSTWPSALHAMELTDTIEISLRRGRMIEVHDQQLTEQLAFKGMMSAVGCGVLMVLPPLLLVGGWLAEQLGLPVADYWPHVLLALLVAFLAFQLLPKLLLSPPPAGSETESDGAGSETESDGAD